MSKFWDIKTSNVYGLFTRIRIDIIWIFTFATDSTLITHLFFSRIPSQANTFLGIFVDAPFAFD